MEAAAPSDLRIEDNDVQGKLKGTQDNHLLIQWASSMANSVRLSALYIPCKTVTNLRDEGSRSTLYVLAPQLEIEALPEFFWRSFLTGQNTSRKDDMYHLCQSAPSQFS